MVMQVSMKELKANLSRYLKAVRAGKDVVVTSRGHPVARLVPLTLSNEAEPTKDELLRRLNQVPGIAMGKGTGKPKGSKKPIEIKPGERTLSEIVIESRR
jgi:prevent-host-death family protein